MSLEELRRRRAGLENSSRITLENMDKIAAESIRVADVAHNASSILNNLENEFESQTGLNKVDIGFLFFAVALQCVRQYMLTDFKERLTDSEAAAKAKGGKGTDKSDRMHGWYKPSLSEISTNPVPYDAMYGSPDFDLGLGGTTHRFKTLGHDPLLGWVFGTSNVVTSTLTMWNLESYHVKTGVTAAGHKRDKITNRADISKVFAYSKGRLFDEGIEGKQAVGIAMLKHWEHIRSDKYSTAGLPIPIISAISPDIARNLAEYGIDVGNIETIGNQASYAMLINTFIAMIHGMLYDKTKYSSWSVYEVKTRKIILYSNLIASASNIIYVALNVYGGNATAARKLDIGGIIVTIYRLITDTEFIRNVKEEFVFGGFDKMIQGEAYNF
ncbi:MAG: hypothetical protein FWC91_13795 [Defluviitaleaceae bacterium]|nr:hypothetical protein [Defluviitaleaceae bacterium]